MWILSAIPIIGRAIDALAAYANKKVDADLEKYKVNGQVNVKAMEADVSVIQARAELARARAGDPADRLGRILLMWPIGGYVTASVYHLVFHNKLPAWIMLEPKPLDANLTYLFMAVIGYLLVTSWKGSSSFAARSGGAK